MPASTNVLDFGPRYAGSGEMRMWYAPVVTSASERRLVLFSHGRGGNAEQVAPGGTSSDAGGLYRVLRELVRRGYVVASYTWASTTNYGNQAAINQVATNLAAADASLDVNVATSKVAWVGYSMGFALASNWARRNVAATAALVGVAPLTDVDELYSRGAPYSTELDAAYSTWASAGGDTFDPINSIAALAGVPRQLWSGASDTTVLPGDVSGGVQRYALAAGSDAELHAVAGDHGTLWANVDPVTVADFIDAGAWT